MNKAELLEIAKPLLLKEWEVRAIQGGRKSEMRRPLRVDNGLEFFGICTDSTGAGSVGNIGFGIEGKVVKEIKLPHKPGDILYVRETWADTWEGLPLYVYKSRGHEWDKNPWVTVTKFERVEVTG